MLSYLLGRSEFKSKQSVVESICYFEKYEDSELLEEASTLLIFKNETQQCWLVFTNARIYFVLNDTEKSLLKALWARDKENLVSNGRINLHLKEEKYSKETGKLFFGKMNNSILYTYSLFNSQSISASILSLAQHHFIKQQSVLS